MNGGKQPRAPPAAGASRRRNSGKSGRTVPPLPATHARGTEFTTRYPDGRNNVMHTANQTRTHDDPFDLGAVLVIDTAAANGPRRCATDDGCSPTCASSCASAS